MEGDPYLVASDGLLARKSREWAPPISLGVETTSMNFTLISGICFLVFVWSRCTGFSTRAATHQRVKTTRHGPLTSTTRKPRSVSLSAG